MPNFIFPTFIVSELWQTNEHGSFAAESDGEHLSIYESQSEMSPF